MWFENVGAFIDYGFQHIIPEGPDHVLFVIALYLNARSWGSLLMQVTAFTLAHTLTLALAATGVLSVAPEVVEPLIAISIVVLAIEAIAFPDAHRLWRIPVVAASHGVFRVNGCQIGIGYLATSGRSPRPELVRRTWPQDQINLTSGRCVAAANQYPAFDGC
jgi:hydrogenase/urease accessory protein HupE